MNFIDACNWMLALHVPFVSFAKKLDDALDSTLTTDEDIPLPNLKSARRTRPTNTPAPLATPSIQVPFFAPDTAPEVHSIENTLEAKQEMVDGLITTFKTGIEGTISVANYEALV